MRGRGVNREVWRYLICAFTLQAALQEGDFPSGGGVVTGSGGDAAMKTATAVDAFDDDIQTRWCADLYVGNKGSNIAVQRVRVMCPLFIAWIDRNYSTAVKGAQGKI